MSEYNQEQSFDEWGYVGPVWGSGIFMGEDGKPILMMEISEKSLENIAEMAKIK